MNPDVKSKLQIIPIKINGQQNHILRINRNSLVWVYEGVKIK